MREILFRGKRVDNGKWVFGSYAFAPKRKGAFGQIISDLDQEKHYIVSKTDYEYWEVCPETVGQFIGLTDKNGKKIFEGDIIKDNGPRIYMIGYNEELMKYAFLYYHKELKNIYCGGFVSKTDGKSIEVIGNIHDNPELLED